MAKSYKSRRVHLKAHGRNDNRHNKGVAYVDKQNRLVEQRSTGGRRKKHELTLETIAYPGGKDGFFTGSCSCGHYNTTITTEEEARAAWGQHKDSKQKRRSQK